MNLYNAFNLIPRNNWDYGLNALFHTLKNVGNSKVNASNIEKMYPSKPIWTNSGRSALYTILKSLELPVGSDVGVPLYCCSVVFNAICQAGLRPRFIDSNINDCNISIEDLNRKRAGISAIIAVHMFGNPCDIDAISATANGIPVIEDCAQSIFSTYKGNPTGSLSTASFFSFRCGKYISAGEGSTIFCKDQELQKKIEHLVNHYENWSSQKMILDSILTFIKATLYNRPLYGLVGYPIGMRLDKKLNLTAKGGFTTGKISSTYQALIDARLTHFQEKINTQTEHAHFLLNSIKASKFYLPGENPDNRTNWFQFALRFHNPEQRDSMADYLLNQGIDTAKYLDDIVDEARAEYGYHRDCPNAELLAKTILLVPIHYKLSRGDLEHIARSINQGSQQI